MIRSQTIRSQTFLLLSFSVLFIITFVLIISCERQVVSLSTRQKIVFNLNNIPMDPGLSDIGENGQRQIKELIQQMMDNLTQYQLKDEQFGKVSLMNQSLFIWDPQYKALVKFGPAEDSDETEFKFLLTVSDVLPENQTEEWHWVDTQYVKITDQIVEPGIFAVDLEENIYIENLIHQEDISDYEHYILKFNPDGEFIEKIGKDGPNGLRFDINELFLDMQFDKNNNLFIILMDRCQLTEDVSSDCRNYRSLNQPGDKEYTIYYYDDNRPYQITRSGRTLIDMLPEDEQSELPQNVYLDIDEIRFHPSKGYIYFFTGFSRIENPSNPPVNLYNEIITYDLIHGKLVGLPVRVEKKTYLSALNFLGISKDENFLFFSHLYKFKDNNPNSGKIEEVKEILLFIDQTGKQIGEQNLIIDEMFYNIPIGFDPIEGYAVQVINRDNMLICNEFYHEIKEK